MDEANSENSVVKTAGRGVIYITFAKLWFMVAGWTLVFILPRVFKWSVGGDDEQGMALYGAYGIVFTGVSFINNGIITGTIQAVSKFTSEDETRAGAVRRTALLVQGGIGLLLGAIYAGVSGLLAHYWFKSPGLAPLMRLSALIIVAYSCYAVFIGSFNGTRRFNRQALFDITYTTVRSILIVALVAAGFEVLGTVLGFIIAAVFIALLAGLASRGGGGGSFPARRYLKFAWVLIFYTFVLNLVMMMDLFILTGVVPRLAADAGQDPAAVALLAEVRAGQYRAVQQLAFIPYQAVLSIAFVIFPLISKVTSMEDHDTARVYVRKALRFTAILIVGLATVFAALPEQAMGLVFEREYLVAAPALRVLPLGMCAFGLMAVGNTILNGAGHPWRAMAVVCAGLVSMVVSVFVMVSLAGPGPECLLAAAAGTTVGVTVALAACGLMVHRRFGTFWPWLSMLRVAAASCAVIIAGSFMPAGSKLLTLAECAGALVAFVIILAVTREFSAQDLSQLRQVLRKGR